MPTPIIVPGLHGSEPAHWQSWMQARLPGAVRVMQQDWSEPDVESWGFNVRREIERAPDEVILVAHSFGVLAAVEALNTPTRKVVGALLVAPASPSRFGERITAPISRDIGIPSLIVASRNDPWMSLAEASVWAEIWGSEVRDLGNAGHINTASGFGPWPDGLELYERLESRARSFIHCNRKPDFFEQLGEIT